MTNFKKSIIGGALIIVAIFGYLIYFQNTAFIKLPPKIVIVEDYYASSTNEMVIIWDIENAPDIPLYNTGIRYDTISHSTTTPDSETYSDVKLPPVINESGNFEIRIDFGESDELYYRVQAKPPHTDGFLWTEERNIKKIVVDTETNLTQ